MYLSSGTTTIETLTLLLPPVSTPLTKTKTTTTTILSSRPASSGTNNSSSSDLQDRGAEMDFYQTSPAVNSANEILVSSMEYDLQDRGAVKDFYQTSPAVNSTNEILVSSTEYDLQDRGAALDFYQTSLPPVNSANEFLVCSTKNHCDLENRDQSWVQPTCSAPAPLQGPNSSSDLKDRGAVKDFYQTSPAVNSANEILVSSTEYDLQDKGNGLDFYQTSLPPVDNANEFLVRSTKNHCDLENRDQSWVRPTCPVPAPMQGPNSSSDLKDRGAGMDFYQTSPPMNSANKIWNEVCLTESHCDLENQGQPWVRPTCPVPAPLQGPSSNIQDRGAGMDFYHTSPPSDSANEILVCSTENHCDLENQGQPWRSNLQDRDAGNDFYQTSPPVNNSANESLVCSTEENHSDLENQGYPWGRPGCPVPALSSDLQDRGTGMDFYHTSPPVNSANEILVCSTENQGQPWDQPGCPVPVSLQGPKEASTITTTTEDKEEMFNSLQSLVDLANSDRESSSERVNLR